MNNKYKILAEFIKDASSETANIETYLFVKKNISNYQLNVDIHSKALKDKIIEVNIAKKIFICIINKHNNYLVKFFSIFYT